MDTKRIGGMNLWWDASTSLKEWMEKGCFEDGRTV